MYFYLISFRPPLHIAVPPEIQGLNLLLVFMMVLGSLGIHRIMSTLAASQVVFPPLVTVLLRLLPGNGAVSPKQIYFVPSKTNRWEEIKKKSQGLETLTTPPAGI